MLQKETLLLACGTRDSRIQLRKNLEEAYNLLEATNLRQVMTFLEQNLQSIAGIIIDLTTPDKQDTEMLADKTVLAALAQHPSIVIVENDESPILNTAFSRGASDVIPLYYDPYAMVHRIEAIVHLHRQYQQLEEKVWEQAQKLRQSSEAMVDALSSIIEYRSVESGQHILRIRHFTRVLLEQVAKDCPEYALTTELINVIASASVLHDVGKIGIPDAILTKPGKLTPEEMEIMRSHTTIGCHILESLGTEGNEEYLRYAHNICNYHHERWDGKGYPWGLSEDSIPICAQVVGLADVYDALTTKRVYKEAYDFHIAVTMILNGECGLFSPKLLECFRLVVPKFQELAEAYADGLSPKETDLSMDLPQIDENPAEDSNSILSNKFQCLLEYTNCFVLELAPDQDFFHLRYNPYPELDIVRQTRTIRELYKAIMQYIVAPHDLERMQKLIKEDVDIFLQEGIRRKNYIFDFQDGQGSYSPFQLTLMRANPRQTQNRTLAVICRKLSDAATFGYIGKPESAYTMYDELCCRNDKDLTIVSVDSTLAYQLLYNPEDLAAACGGRLLELVHPDDRAPLLASLKEQFAHRPTAQTEFRVLRKDGQHIWVICKSRIAPDLNGSECLYNHLTNITASKKAYDALRKQLSSYEIILAQTENVLFEWDIKTDRITFSDTWRTIFGLEAPSDNFRTVLMEGYYIHPDDLPLLMDRLQALELGSHFEMQDLRMATSQGHYLWCRIRASSLRDEDGKLKRIVGIIVNVDDEKQAERALKDRADRDMLTKLLNKTAARKRIEDYLHETPEGANCAMLILDMDNFKQINDHFGHLYGDSILVNIAKEIKRMFRAYDVVSRIGGDEFLVLMRNISDRTLVENRCRRLLNAIRATLRVSGLTFPGSCSIGVSMAPEHGKSYLELFRHADLALYLAKAQGRDQFAFYTPDAARLSAAKSTFTAVNHHIDSDDTPGLANSSLVQHAFRQLYASQDLDVSIQEVLELIGKQTNVSRVYVFENSFDNRYCTNTYEWCNTGIRPEIHNLQQVSYETDIPGYESNFDENGILYCSDITLMEDNARKLLAAQNIKSILQCAIRENGVFLGYIGFDECEFQRSWTQEQIELLTYFSEILSVFLLKRRAQAHAQQQIQELQRLLATR